MQADRARRGLDLAATRIALAVVALSLAARAVPTFAQARGADWSAVDQAFGRPGKPQPGGVQKYAFPRGDLRVIVGDVTVKPALALGSWVALKLSGAAAGEALAMGDLVLLESEVPAVIKALQDGGVQQTALHNHLQHESPRVLYLHIEGRGDPVRLATTIRTALAATGTPPAAAPTAPPPFPLDTAALARALHHGGSVNGGVYQVAVPRAETVRMDGVEIPPAMGVATAINFQPTGGARAAVAGDLVLTASEVNPVMRTLEQQGIAVTALHSHMLGEEPRLLFMHFWANDDAQRLARGLRLAIEQMGAGPTGP